MVDANIGIHGRQKLLCIQDRIGGMLGAIFAACFLLWSPSQGQERWQSSSELAILDTAIIPMAPITGMPLLVILRIYANDPSVPEGALSAGFHLSIEQDGRVLTTVKPMTVQIPNGQIGEIRYQFKAGPPGTFGVRARIERGRLSNERLLPLRIAADQAESDAITQRFLSVCTGLEGGFTALSPVTGEPYCACAPGMGINAVGNRCEEWP